MGIQWSNSADWVLQRCRRKFWFQYIYASPRAKWENPRRKAYILSNARTLETWRGSLVHTVVQDYVTPRLQQGVIPSEADLLTFALDRARRQLEFSSKKRYKQEGMTKTKGGDSYAVIWEDEFESQASKITPSEALDEIKLALANLLKLTELLEGLCKSSWSATEPLLRLKDFEISVVGRVDLMAVCGGVSPELRLIDWKLDRKQRHDYAPQLWLYAYLFDKVDHYQGESYRYEEIPRRVKSLPKSLLEVNLLYSSISNPEWGDQQARMVADRIFRGIQKIKALVDGRRPAQIHGGEFRVTENPNNCNYCPFRQLCQAL